MAVLTLRLVWFLSLLFGNAASSPSPAPTTHAGTVTQPNVTFPLAPQTSTHASPETSPSQSLNTTVLTGNVFFTFRGRCPPQSCPQISVPPGRKTLLWDVSMWWWPLWSSPSAANSGTTTVAPTSSSTETTASAKTSSSSTEISAQPRLSNTSSNGWSRFSWYRQHKSVGLNVISLCSVVWVSEILILIFFFYPSFFILIWTSCSLHTALELWVYLTCVYTYLGHLSC